MNKLIDKTDLEIIQNLYLKSTAKNTCYELKIGHSTYTRRVKRLMKNLNFSDVSDLKKWIIKNLSA